MDLMLFLVLQVAPLQNRNFGSAIVLKILIGADKDPE
jgi:hypothetical protein